MKYTIDCIYPVCSLDKDAITKMRKMMQPYIDSGVPVNFNELSVHYDGIQEYDNGDDGSEFFDCFTIIASSDPCDTRNTTFMVKRSVV